jgi:hypothetical protein
MVLYGSAHNLFKIPMGSFALRFEESHIFPDDLTTVK